MPNAYYAIIAATADLSASVPVLGWAAIDLNVRDGGTSAPAAAPDKSSLLSGGTVPVSAPADGASQTRTLTDEEAQTQADRYAGENRHAVRIGMTDEQWAARPLCGAVLEKGTVRQGEPAATPVQIRDQARAAMRAVMAATQSHGWGVFEPMPDAVTAYGRALAAIVNDADTICKALPDMPDEMKQ